MNLIALSCASAALGTALIAAGPAQAQMSYPAADMDYLNNPHYARNYGYPYNYAHSYRSPDYWGRGYRYPSRYGYGYGRPYDYWGYPYRYAYDYGRPYGWGGPFGTASMVTAPIAALAQPLAAAVTAPLAVAADATAPFVTGRSVATGQTGNHCATPVKTCMLHTASYVGNGCSCKVSGGRSRGSVTP